LTVVFCGVVGSTVQAARPGGETWGEVVEAKWRREIARRQRDAGAAEAALREAQRLYCEICASLHVERLGRELGT
jgi:hypothetical protein